LEPTRMNLSLDRSRAINITFSIDAEHFQELSHYLKNILGSRLYFTPSSSRNLIECHFPKT